MSLHVSAQTIDLPLHNPSYSWLYFSKNEQALTLSAVKPISRRNIQTWLVDSVSRSFLPVLTEYSKRDLLLSQPTTIVSKRFYNNGASFWQKENEDYLININPVWQIGTGLENFNGKNQFIFTNSRGLEVWGSVDKVGFYSNFTENQAILPSYIKFLADSTGVLPFEGFWKETSARGVDFLRANGHIDFALSKHIHFQTGFGKHHFGYGQRSLFLSDFSNAYPYFKFTTEFWRIKYTQLVAELTADVFTFAGGTLGSRQYPKKWMSTHYLEMSMGKNVTLGLFESLINGKPDSLGGSSLKLSYLNPVIFYRAVEQQDGSSDNAIVGIEIKIMPWSFLVFHGQFLLDELIIQELTAGNKWWGNKYAVQLGMKLLEPGIKNFQLQTEVNMARPFTYTHESSYTAYTHYRLPLAHPLGANFAEVLIRGDYQTSTKWWFSFQSFFAKVGTDEKPLISMGNDPNIPYTRRLGEYNHKWFQGNQSRIAFGQLTVSYQLFHNLFFDVQGIYRKEQFEKHVDDRKTAFVMISMRWNAVQRTNNF